LHHQQANRSGTLHNYRVTDIDPATPNAMEGDGRRFHLRRFLISEIRVGVEHPIGRDRDASSKAAMWGREGIPASGNGRHRSAVLSNPGSALGAASAGGWNGYDNAIARVDVPHSRTEVPDGPGPLVTADRRTV